MTPPSLDVGACNEKLLLLADLVSDLERQGEPTSSDLTGDRDRRHVIERVLTQLVDIATGLNATIARSLGHRPAGTYRETFDIAAEAGVLDGGLAARLRRAVGMRNILTHEYGRIDLEHVAAAVPRARADFTAYIAAVRTFLDHHESERRSTFSDPT